MRRSRASNLMHAKDAVVNFVKALTPQDEVLIIAFSDWVDVLGKFRLDAKTIEREVKRIRFDEEVAPEARVAQAARLHTLLDRVSPRAVQLVVLNDATPLLRHRVLRDGIVLAGEHDPRRVRFEGAALCEYLDVLPMPEQYDRALIARAKAGRLGT